MANNTDPTAMNIHGTNPQNLIEKIMRNRIYSATYWKEHCFGLTAETLVDKAMDLTHFGGMYGGNKKPTPFICLILKMLQIQPEKEILVELIKNEDFKYVRLLGAFYLRLTGKPVEIYEYLEPLYNDYRKVKKLTDTGFVLSHVDEVIEELINSDFSCDVALPYLTKRPVLELNGTLEPRVSALEDDLEDDENGMEIDEKDNENQQAENAGIEKNDISDNNKEHKEESSSIRSTERRRSRSRSAERDNSNRKRRSRSNSRERRRSKERSRSRERRRSTSRDRERSRRSRSRDSERRRRSRSRSNERERRRSPERSRRSRSRDRERRRSRDRSRRSRSREYERDRRSRRSRSRERGRDYRRSRSPDRNRRSRSRERDDERIPSDSTNNDRRPKGRVTKLTGALKLKRPLTDPSKEKKTEEKSDLDEIAEMNKLRASLGLPPLKQK